MCVVIFQNVLKPDSDVRAKPLLYHVTDTGYKFFILHMFLLNVRYHNSAGSGKPGKVHANTCGFCLEDRKSQDESMRRYYMNSS